jgi:hypothetical protein
VDENQTPPTPPTPPTEPPKEQPSNVIDFLSRKRRTAGAGVVMQEDDAENKTPDAPRNQVIKLTPKEVVEFEKLIGQAKDMWMRRSSCMFERSHRPQGCTCNYCVYINSMSLRVFDMIQSDMSYQMKRGKMLFCTPDMLDILQIAIERVIAFEEMQRKGPQK